MWPSLLHCRIIPVLFIWILAGTLAWVDLLDLQDGLAWPLIELQQALEVDADDPRDSVALVSPAADPIPGTSLLSPSALRVRPAVWERVQSHARPLQSKLSVFRL